jgi:hypothetical protein
MTQFSAPTREQFLTLTGAQRRALIAHLSAWAVSVQGSATIQLAIQRMADRLYEGKPTGGPSSDLEVLAAAVHLNPARAEIPDRTFKIVQRAWTKLGLRWDWAEDYKAQTEASARRVRELLEPGFKPPPPPPPVLVPVKVQDDFQVKNGVGTLKNPTIHGIRCGHAAMRPLIGDHQITIQGYFRGEAIHGGEGVLDFRFRPVPVTYIGRTWIRVMVGDTFTGKVHVLDPTKGQDVIVTFAKPSK